MIAGFFHRRGSRLAKVAGATMLGLLGVPGCRPAPSAPSGDASARVEQVDVGDPEAYLAGVFGRYRSSAFYADAGRAHLEVRDRAGGRPEQTAAPLRVRWNSKRLAVDAYAVRLRGARDEAGQRLAYRAWIHEPATSHFDRQMLVTTVADSSGDRPNLDPLLGDEVLRARMSAGLAGPPPQLEWLFADEPMSGLFDASSRFEQIADAPLRGETMRRIAVLSRGQQYVFWINPTTSVIGRVELPVPESLRKAYSTGGAAGPGGQSSDPGGQRGTSDRPPAMELTLELDGATFDPQAWRDRQPGKPAVDWSPDFTPTPVSRLVPVPPPPPPAVIGRTVSQSAIASLAAGSRPDGSGKPWVIVRLPERRAAVMAVLPQLGSLVSSPPSGEAAAARLALIAQTSDQKTWLRPLVGEGVPVADVRDAEALIAQLRLPAEAIATVGADGRVFMIQNSLSAEAFRGTRAAVQDSSAGVDVPEKLNADYQTLVDAYRQARREATTSQAFASRHSAVFRASQREAERAESPADSPR